MPEIQFVDGTAADSYAACRIFLLAVYDLLRRTGQGEHPPEQDREKVDEEWPKMRSLYEHLARNAEHFVLAKVEGEPVGYARSILRGDLRELTEFFVLPGQQSAGVGRELLARVFPKDGTRFRIIIATTDRRALARYMKSSVYPRFPIYNFSREPRAQAVPGSLDCEEIRESDETLRLLNTIDQAVLGYTREAEHRWLLSDRQGLLFRQGAEVVGYGYAGWDSGPFALLNRADYPAALAHAENVASQRVKKMHLEVPLINSDAVDYLLAQGFEMGSFTALFMSNLPFGRFENYICTSPPFTL